MSMPLMAGTRSLKTFYTRTTWLLCLGLLYALALVYIYSSFQLPASSPSGLAAFNVHTGCTFATTDAVIDAILHVVVVVYNPCHDVRRFLLARDAVAKLEVHSPHVAVYVVELVLGHKKTFWITDPRNKRHLQLRAGNGSLPLWYKENLLNIGVQTLLPSDWKAVAWVDADVEFDNPSWASLTLKQLDSKKDVVQLFSHAVFLDGTNGTDRVFSGYAYNFIHERAYQGYGNDLWHPGFAWAYSRAAYDRMGGFYETELSGLGDGIMAHALRGGFNWAQYKPQFSSDGHLRSILAYNESCKGLRMGYIPGVVRHHFHGSYNERNYLARRRVYDQYGFDPLYHLKRDAKSGLLMPTQAFPRALAEAVRSHAYVNCVVL